MGEPSSGGVTVGIVMLILLAFLYFIPTIIAVKRDHPSYLAIFAVNLILGWMLIGWVIALVWSLSGISTPVVVPQKVVNETPKEKPSLTEQLEELSSLKEKGLLTEEEFSAKKAQILG